MNEHAHAPGQVAGGRRLGDALDQPRQRAVVHAPPELRRRGSMREKGMMAFGFRGASGQLPPRRRTRCRRASNRAPAIGMEARRAETRYEVRQPGSEVWPNDQRRTAVATPRNGGNRHADGMATLAWNS